MAFTAADVKKLREMTNVGMMDCKKALSENDGDMDKAIEWLREKGLAKAAKKASRIAAEGMAYAVVENGIGAVVEVNAETDFASKAPVFVDFVKDIAKVVVDNDPADLEALKACKYPGSDLTVAEMIPEKVMVIGENLQIRRFARFGKNTSVSYVHAGGKIGVLVNLEVSGGIDATQIGKDIAMQIAALNPRFWDKSDVSDAVLEAVSYTHLTHSGSTLQNRPIFRRISSVIGASVRQTSTSGWMPTESSSLTECCVGLLFSSPEPGICTTSGTWINTTFGRPFSQATCRMASR